VSAVAQYLKEKEALERSMRRHEESRREAATAIGEQLIAAGALDLKLNKLVRIVELAVAAGESAALSALSGAAPPARVKSPKPEKMAEAAGALPTASEGPSDVQ